MLPSYFALVARLSFSLTFKIILLTVWNMHDVLIFFPVTRIFKRFDEQVCDLALGCRLSFEKQSM